MYIGTGILGLHVPVGLTIDKFSDLVIGYSLLPVGNRVSQSERIFAKLSLL